MKTLLTLILSVAGSVVFGQAGHIDTTFNAFPGNSGHSDRITAGNDVRTVTPLPNGKILLSGMFQDYDGIGCVHMVRVNADGTHDNSFTFTDEANTIYAVAARPDGKILIGGSFTDYGDTEQRRGLGLVNADGSPDSGFNLIYTGISNGYVADIVSMSNGDALFAGEFSTYSDANGTFPFSNIGKIHADGTGDPSFTPDLTPGVTYKAIAVLPNGKIIAAGSFSGPGVPQSCYIVRLNSDGTLDQNLSGNTPSEGEIYDVAVLPNGLIAIAGTFTEKIRVIDADGLPVPGFSAAFAPYSPPAPEINPVGMYKLLAQPDGKILAGGNFAYGPGATGFGRLNADGSWDNTFAIGDGMPEGRIYDLAYTTDGNILAGGYFHLVNGTSRSFIAAVDTNGTVLPRFVVTGANEVINKVAVRPDGKVAIAGSFSAYQGTPRKALALLRADGTLDASFEPASVVHSVASLAFQQDNKLLVSGGIDGQNRIIRLKTDGSIDPSFDAGTGPDTVTALNTEGYIQAILPLNDGKILVGGQFDSFNGVNVAQIARLNADGSVDTTFNCLLNGQVWFLSSQPDGKVIVSGFFDQSNGVQHTGCVRLYPDGSNDESFQPAPMSGYGTVIVQPDGKILVAGQQNHAGVFTGVTRLNTNGSEDNTFVPGQGTDVAPLGMLLQPDGKIILYGNISLYEGGVDEIVRLHPDGTRDFSFFAYSGIYTGQTSSYSAIKAAVIQPSGRIVAGGAFLHFDGVRRNHLAGILNDVSGYTALNPTFSGISEISCAAEGQVTASCTGGAPPYSFLWSTGDTTATISLTASGVYQVFVTDSLGTSGTAALLIGAPSTPATDLNAHLGAMSFRPGFAATVQVDAFNSGCTPVTGQLKVVADTLLSFVSATPTPSSISGDTLIWDFTDLTYDSTHITPQIEFTTSVLAAIGDSIDFTVIMTPVSADADTTNNIKTYSFPVVNGYDPNTKSVYPAGKCEGGYIQPDQLLTYTVQFQNTGNSEAINIYVTDSLDAGLDLNTVRVIGKSHEMWTEVLPGNVLKFHFDNIYLADSTSNEAESHGYVIFEVKPLALLPHNTAIANNVGIYFDFNPPVLTNTVTNRIYVGDLDAFTCTDLGTDETLTSELLLFPNPTLGDLTIDFGADLSAAHVIVTDAQGKTVAHQSVSGKTANLNLERLENGMYFVSVADKNGKIIHRNQKISKANR